jgi:hypothetical protein
MKNAKVGLRGIPPIPGVASIAVTVYRVTHIEP